MAAAWFLLQKERLYRPMWMVRAAVLAVLLLLLGGDVAEAVGFGAIAGLLWELLNEISGRRPLQ